MVKTAYMNSRLLILCCACCTGKLKIYFWSGCSTSDHMRLCRLALKAPLTAITGTVDVGLMSKYVQSETFSEV